MKLPMSSGGSGSRLVPTFKEFESWPLGFAMFYIAYFISCIYVAVMAGKIMYIRNRCWLLALMQQGPICSTEGCRIVVGVVDSTVGIMWNMLFLHDCLIAPVIGVHCWHNLIECVANFVRTLSHSTAGIDIGEPYFFVVTGGLAVFVCRPILRELYRAGEFDAAKVGHGDFTEKGVCTRCWSGPSKKPKGQ